MKVIFNDENDCQIDLDITIIYFKLPDFSNNIFIKLEAAIKKEIDYSCRYNDPIYDILTEFKVDSKNRVLIITKWFFKTEQKITTIQNFKTYKTDLIKILNKINQTIFQSYITDCILQDNLHLE